MSAPLRVFEATRPDERVRVMRVRREVFVQEQGIAPELELDALDDQARHFLALWDGAPVGAARMRRTSRGFKLERVAVLQAYRDRGIARAIVAKVLELLPDDATVYVHAQQSALGFWERVGFTADGEPFVEASIPHRLMRLWR